MDNLTKVLATYGIKGEVVKINDGPLVKQIEFLPEAGTKIKNIITSLDDIARELGTNSLRVEAIDNSNNIGFEVPQEKMAIINFKQILDSESFANAKGNLPICLGVDIKGEPKFADLAKMPHLLVAGTTGSGKSVGLNTFILSLIKLKNPNDLKFVLIDPKRIEFSMYNNQKYMLFPVVTDNSIAAQALDYLVEEMERRYGLFEQSMSKNIEDYKAKGEHLPYIVCVIDEFSDLVTTNKKVEKAIMLLAQKARACGIHIILATQRPSVDVVTGVLKANFPTRLSYKVASRADSGTILDTSGAEKLIGRGDSLFLASDGNLQRIHGAYMQDIEIENMLHPYRCTIKPVEFKPLEEPKKATAIKEREGKSWLRKVFNFFANLRKRDWKLIFTALSWLVGMFLGSKKKK